MIWLEQVRRDFVYGFRTQRKTPASSVALVLTLALGIAATSVSFTVTNGLFLSPLPVHAPDRLIRIYATSSSSGGMPYLPTSYPDYLDIRDERTSFSGVIAEQPVPYNVTVGGRTERIWGQLVSGGYFTVLGVRPIAGRFFSAEEESRHGGDPVVVISHALWQRLTGGTAADMPDRILLNGHPVRVIGSAPKSFHGTTPGLLPDVWVPTVVADQLYPATNWLEQRGGRWFFLTARLAAGATPDAARAALDALSARLQREYPITNQGVRFALMSEAESRIHPLFHRQLFGASTMSLIVALLVLLIACANVAGVLLVRASARRREMGVRVAIGATRARIVQQLFTEHAFLALAAGAVGFGVAYLTTSMLGTIEGPLSLPMGMPLRTDARVLAFASVLTVVTGVLFGLAPALDAARTEPVTMVKTGDAAEAPKQSRSRSALVAAQVAVSILLLVSGGLFFRNLQAAQRIDVGFEPDRLVMTSFDLGLQNYSAGRAKAFWPRLMDRLALLPAAESSALVSNVPFELTTHVASLAPAGYSAPPDGSWPVMGMAIAGERYFATMRIPLLEGREFTARDDEGSPKVVVVNDVLARQFWPEGGWAGRRLTDKAGHLFEVAGVVKRGKYLTLGEDPKPYVYFPLRQSDMRSMTVVVRGRGDAAGILRALGEEIHALEPAVPLYGVKSLSQHLAIALAPAKGGAATLSAVGLVALLLTSLGLYGTVAYAVTRRTYEIGVRRALGARDRDVARLVIRDAASLVLVGVGCGGVMALAASRLLGRFLYGVDAFDPLVFGSAVLVLIVVCGCAAWVPTRRAIQLEAGVALRCG